MSTRARRLLPLVGVTAWLCVSCVSLPRTSLDIRRLTPSQTDTLQTVLHTLGGPINAKKQGGSANLLTWEELYAPLSPTQRAFLDVFRTLKAKDLGATSHYFGELTSRPDLVAVGPQRVLKHGAATTLDPQYLPRPVFEAYQLMMADMQADLGKRLLVESGYRSPAYQLYLFLFYLPKHGFSIIETNRFVALPGHSEHGFPSRQAIDFINEEGVDGEDHPEEFEALPEFRWLQQHAKAFRFVLSYPRDNPYHTSFEPWHWHFEGGGQ